MRMFTAILLVFSLMMLSVNLYAKEKRGAKLIIYRKSEKGEISRLVGTPWEKPGIRGELITVKEDSLLLLDTEGEDVSVSIADIKVIRIEKKSKAPLVIGIGLLGGVMGGAMIGYWIWEHDRPLAAGEIESWKDDFPSIFWSGASIGAGIGLLLGALAVSKSAETIQIEGMTDSEIQKTLEKLRKKARIRDYK